jgi:uncharacterized membrane protein YqjE
VKFAGGWSGRLREVGEAFVEVVRSEIAVVAADLGATGRQLARALLLVAAAAAVAFWTLGLLLYFAVELLALVLPRWGAVGSVLGLFAVVTVGLLLGVWSRLKSIESPAATLRRHFDDHRQWWSGSIAAGGPEGPGEEEP